MDSAPGRSSLHDCCSTLLVLSCASDSFESSDFLLCRDQLRVIRTSSPEMNLRCRLDFSLDMATLLLFL